MKYIFGPLKSRRLGNSLGINLTPCKICSFDCVYCQLGKTTEKTAARKEYIKVFDILDEFKAWLTNNPQGLQNIDYITLSGSGEPTLNIKIGELIAGIKSLTNLPIAILTNSSSLVTSLGREAISAADLVVPSLDAASDKVFERINRPASGIKIEEIIQGLVDFRKLYKGKIWLEVMLARGINDDLRHIRKLKEAIDLINPDKIQLNSPVRSTAEPDIYPVRPSKL